LIRPADHCGDHQNRAVDRSKSKLSLATSIEPLIRAPTQVSVDLQPSSAPQEASEAPTPGEATGARVTSHAAERLRMSADTVEIVSQPGPPRYPVLAHQMKVEGSVIQALIGRDALIQDLRVLSGPPILATAAEEAVKQWHFKPHVKGAETVETQTMITVNFTISTN
jgi:protein TonB